jgi:hypothetical protein
LTFGALYHRRPTNNIPKLVSSEARNPGSGTELGVGVRMYPEICPVVALIALPTICPRSLVSAASIGTH